MNQHAPAPNSGDPIKPNAEPTRMDARTQKIVTGFGSIYATVGFDAEGRARHVHVSNPGRHMDTAVGDALDALGAAVTQIIQDMHNEGAGHGES